jgi:hypothetical protein
MFISCDINLYIYRIPHISGGFANGNASATPRNAWFAKTQKPIAGTNFQSPSLGIKHPSRQIARNSSRGPATPSRILSRIAYDGPVVQKIDMFIHKFPVP